MLSQCCRHHPILPAGCSLSLAPGGHHTSHWDSARSSWSCTGHPPQVPSGTADAPHSFVAFRGAAMWSQHREYHTVDFSARRLGTAGSCLAARGQQDTPCRSTARRGGQSAHGDAIGKLTSPSQTRGGPSADFLTH